MEKGGIWPIAPKEWKNNLQIYTYPNEILSILHDPGVPVAGRGKGNGGPAHRFRLLEKLCAKIYANILMCHPNYVGFDKNVSRGKMHLLSEIIMLRKHVDVVESHPFFHAFAKDGKVFMLMNDPRTCGLDVAIGNLQASIDAANRKTNNCRMLQYTYFRFYDFEFE